MTRKNSVTDEQFRQAHRRTFEVTRRLVEGTLSFEPTMVALQEIIEGKYEPAKQREEVCCEVFSGCRCTICGAYFSDGDNICANGHQIGCTY